jgi:hypothetical protein
MGKVKPTQVTTPRIIQPGERGARPWLWALFLVAFGAWSWQVFQFGQQRVGVDASRSGQAQERLLARVAELEQERDALRAAAARFERLGQFDRAAADGVKSEVKALQEERAELKREVAFLKTLVSGSEGKELLLEDFRLTKGSGRTHFFEVTLAKGAEDEATVIGRVILRVKGRFEGRPKTLGMEALTDGARSNIGIRFKNFQKLKTELQLPEGFEPAVIEVGVTTDGKAFRSFEQAFDWKVSDA